jgi:hypothetical protein
MTVPPTVDGLVAKWATLVKEVETGYELTIYDYTNDLSVRDHLEELLTRAGLAATPVKSAIQHWDDRFRFATTETSSTTFGTGEEAGWWWRRMPRLIGDELRSDLEEAD